MEPATISDREPSPLPGIPSELADSKLHPPRARPGIVTRNALVDRLVAAPAVSIIAVVAPPGYGKSTLLAQWAERRRPRVAWVSCDDGDNDPAALLSALAVALDRVEPVDPAVFRMLAAGAGVTVVPRLMAAIAATHAPVALALDHVEALTNRECLDTLAEFALSLPPGWQLALASRHPVPLPVGRLRVQGRLVEIGAHDLAMGRAEAAALLAGAGLQLGEAGTRELVERTEGWPVGLYLAALAMRAGTPQREAGFGFPGDDRYLHDYLRSELLDRASPAEMSFLTRTSVLDRHLRATLRRGARPDRVDRVLEQLEARNLLRRPARPSPGVVPVPPPAARAAAGGAQPPRAGPGPEAALPGGRVVRGEGHAGGGDRARSGGGRHRPGRPAGPGRGAAGLGQRARRDGPALDELVRARGGAGPLPGGRRARRADLRAARPAGGDRAVGGRRPAGVPDRHAPRREHDGEPAGVPARDPGPGRRRGDATRRADQLRRA